ncbi:uncharacterized protein L3040_008939 [Drepanopeziza brunnea f. sp. 'multigermtubi']|uniref:uncharacterized protein n=1 Tax=Drepanopeziza brunnea f. sp. 'multigermtubi' TaxID=698441 RepID=UPI0023947C8C|nr:hypothetical protein L3040_008939 [Drepanopeziza brunnea f. sp. 'multigermtubi']
MIRLSTPTKSLPRAWRRQRSLEKHSRVAFKSAVAQQPPDALGADVQRRRGDGGRARAGSSRVAGHGMLDDHPDAFAWFVTWLYRSEVPEGKTVSYQRILYNLYVLGEKLLLNELPNKTMDRIRENHAATHKVSGASSRHSEYVGMLYDNTLEDSPIRKFIVQMMAYDYFNSLVASGSAGLIGGDALRYPLNPAFQLSFTFDNCRFHRHGSGEICYLRTTHLNQLATSATPSNSLASSQHLGAVPTSQFLFVFGRN